VLFFTKVFGMCIELRVFGFTRCKHTFETHVCRCQLCIARERRSNRFLPKRRPRKSVLICFNQSFLNFVQVFLFYMNKKKSIVSATFAFDSIDKDVIFMNTNGQLNQDQLNNLLNHTKQYAIDKIFPLITKLTTEKYTKFNS
jgi:hypothetical protein